MKKVIVLLLLFLLNGFIIVEDTKIENIKEYIENKNENVNDNNQNNENDKINGNNYNIDNITDPSKSSALPNNKPSLDLPEIKETESDIIILNQNEIQKFNSRTMKKTSSMFDLENIKTLTKENITNYIENYKFPSLPKYNGNHQITNEEIETISENRNINDIKSLDNIQKGIIFKRTNLKSFPTDIHFYDNIGIEDYDRIQETELAVNTPVLIVHESSDKIWSFVISNTYMGWVKNSDIALATDEDWNYFKNPEFFAVVTDPKVEVENTYLDMGVKLPFVKESSGNYEIILPIKNENGFLNKKNITVSKDKMNVGYLPYTHENVLKEAKKYLGTIYSWGSMDDGVDCSGFISNVYKTFGFAFPRNTSNQKTSIGNIISLENKTNEDKLKMISKYKTALLYQPGHVMLYTGIKGNEEYIIHASGSSKKVTETKLNGSNYLSKIDRLALVE